MIWLAIFNFLISKNIFLNPHADLDIKKQIYIYKIEYKEYKYVIVRGLALVEGDLYVQPKNSRLMTYSGLSKKAKKIDNLEIYQLMSEINIVSMKNLQNISNCNCSAITKNEFVIRIVDGANIDNFVFSEEFKCNPSSDCLLLEKFHYAFKLLE